ncbi:cytochrome P450 [Mucor mucedo]|uniref:cytochrome P450 n=1 Tax=Mucor mucedo TaxID=29922 RepID=UPI00222020E8|nr:cytochrome P450 [Mucor mucedo]KAI7897291.1 cytochrome P450 [Mucor mucedo]
MTSSHILSFYELYILPSVKNDKKKLTYVGSAIAATLFYTLYRKIALPPAGIRAIPRVNFFSYVASVLQGEDPHHQLKYLYSPLISKANGVYVRPNRAGWSVYVTNPVDIKKVYLKGDLFPKDSHSFGEGDTLINGMIRTPSILTSVGAKWKLHRKAANPAFHRAMPVNLFGRLTQQLFTEIEKEDGTMNMSAYLERFGFDAITAAGFGYNANAIGDKNSEWVRYYTTLVKGVFNPFFFLFPIFDTKLRWMFPSRVRLHQTLKDFLAKVEQIIIEKRLLIAKQGGIDSLDDAEKDLCTLMIEAEAGEGGALTNEEMMNDVLAFILAGHDTTANALGSAMYYLANHKDFQQKLRDEAIHYLGDAPCDVIPTVEQTKDMPYVNMVIKETLRIMGPAVWGQPRVAAEDTELGGFMIPKGTIVTTDIIGVQHDANIWQDPETFNPERFNPENEDSKRINNAWLPFGNGQRQCIGMNMSLAEQRVLLIMMARKYVWSLPKDSIHKDGMVINGMDIVGPKELILDFTKRY